jgi:hypothetical protein
MRLVIGSVTFDGLASASTNTSTTFRLDMERPFVPKITGNELRIDGLRAYIETASESACKTAVDALRLVFDTANGKDVTYSNTTGTALFAVLTADWPELEIEYEIDQGDVNAVAIFNVVARRPSPPSAGSADETGQRGEIEWELELGGNRLEGATATAEFGPSTGATAVQNAAAWVTKMFTEPLADAPAFFSTRLQAITCLHRAIQKPNQASDLFDPIIVSVLFREAYSGIGAIPPNCKDFNVTVDMTNSEALDVRSGAPGPAMLTLHGWFTVKSEAPTALLSGATKVDPGAIYTTALAAYDAIEANFRTIYASLSLFDLGDVSLSVAPDTGRVVFSRMFVTQNVLDWKENTVLLNTDPVVINRDHKGRDLVHRGPGGPIATLAHSFYAVGLQPIPYTPPPLNGDWVRMDKSQDVLVEAVYRGGRMTFTTRGSSNWRYANPTERGAESPTSAGGRVLRMNEIGNGTLG